MKKIVGFLVAFVLMITLLPIQQAEASTGHHVVKVKTVLNVRENPSPRAKIVGSLKNGKVVYVYSTAPGGWSKIKYNNKAAYVASSYLVEQTPYTPPSYNDYYYYGDWGYSHASNLNVRTSPSKNGKVIGQLQKYEDIYIYGTYSNGWAKVDYYGHTAYVSAQYLSY